MPSNIDSQYTAPVALVFGSGNTHLTSLGDTDGAACDAIDASGAGALIVAPQVEILYKITTGSVAPTDNTLIEFYFGRAKSIAGADFATGSASGAEHTSPQKSQLQFVHAQVVGTATATSYQGSFIVDNPGPFWQLLIVNEIGQDLDSTDTNQVVNYRYISPEVQ